MLTSAAEYSGALALRCPSAHQTIRQLALYAGVKFLELSNDESADSQLESQQQLICVLQQHADQSTWAAALLQPSVSQLPGLLPCILGSKPEVSSQMHH